MAILLPVDATWYNTGETLLLNMIKMDRLIASEYCYVEIACYNMPQISTRIWRFEECYVGRTRSTCARMWWFPLFRERTSHVKMGLLMNAVFLGVWTVGIQGLIVVASTRCKPWRFRYFFSKFVDLQNILKSVCVLYEANHLRKQFYPSWK